MICFPHQDYKECSIRFYTMQCRFCETAIVSFCQGDTFELCRIKFVVRKYQDFHILSDVYPILEPSILKLLYSWLVMFCWPNTYMLTSTQEHQIFQQRRRNSARLRRYAVSSIFNCDFNYILQYLYVTLVVFRKNYYNLDCLNI